MQWLGLPKSQVCLVKRIFCIVRTPKVSYQAQSALHITALLVHPRLAIIAEDRISANTLPAHRAGPFATLSYLTSVMLTYHNLHLSANQTLIYSSHFY